MSRSPQSRGKGNRRMPGRPGGRRKAKGVGAWQRRAQHLVGSASELSQPVVRLDYAGRFGEEATHAAYRLDQAMARLGVRYYAEFRGGAYRTARFDIYVAADHASSAAAAIARLNGV